MYSHLETVLDEVFSLVRMSPDCCIHCGRKKADCESTISFKYCYYRKEIEKIHDALKVINDG